MADVGVVGDSIVDLLIRIGLYIAAVFQLLCLAAIFVSPKATTEEESAEDTVGYVECRPYATPTARLFDAGPRWWSSPPRGEGA